MDEPKLHPVIAELVKNAIADLEGTALRCSEAVERLRRGELLTVLGPLAVSEESIRSAMLVIRTAYDYEQSLKRS